MSYFGVFGYLSHVHISYCERIQRNDKSIRDILLRVSEESKIYRLYDPVPHKIIVSRDAVFDEDNNWDWDKSYKKIVLVKLTQSDNDKESNATTETKDRVEIDAHSNVEELVANGSNEENSYSLI